VKFEDSRLQIEGCEILVYDMGGRLVEETKTGIVGKNLLPGIYFVKVPGYGHTRIIKIGRRK
jgi:hypothetical protein